MAATFQHNIVMADEHVVCIALKGKCFIALAGTVVLAGRQCLLVEFVDIALLIFCVGCLDSRRFYLLYSLFGCLLRVHLLFLFGWLLCVEA